MSLVPSLLQAIVKADGEAMVMHAGDKPYVVSPTGQVELASRGLTLEAVNGIVGQLLPTEIQNALEEFGAIQHELASLAEFPGEHFTVVAARGGDDVWVEIRRRRVRDDDRVPEEMLPPPPAPAMAAPVAPAPVSAVAAPPPVSALPAEVAAHRLAEAKAIAAAVTARADVEDDGEEINLDDDFALPDEAQLFGAPVTPFTNAELAEGHEHEIVAHAPEAIADAPSSAALATPALEETVADEPVARPAQLEIEPEVHIEPPVVELAMPEPEEIAESPLVVELVASAAAEREAPPALEPEAPPEVEPEAPPAPEHEAPPTFEHEVPPAREHAVPPEPEFVAPVPEPAPPPSFETFVEAIGAHASDDVAAPSVAAAIEPAVFEPIVAEMPDIVFVDEIAEIAPSVVSGIIAVSEPQDVPESAPPVERVAALQAEPLAPTRPEPIASPETDLQAELIALVDSEAWPNPAEASAAPHALEVPPVVVANAEAPRVEAAAPALPVVTQRVVPPPVAAPKPREAAMVPEPSRVAPPRVVAPEPRAAEARAVKPPVAEPSLPKMQPPIETPAAAIANADARPPAPVSVEATAPQPRAVPPAAPPPQRRTQPTRAESPRVSPPPMLPQSRHVPPALEAQRPRVADPVAATSPESRVIPPSVAPPAIAAHADEHDDLAAAPQAVVLPISRSPIRGDQLAPSVSDATMPGLDRLLRLASARGASTLYLSSESRPSMRVDGELHVIDAEPVHTGRDVESLLLTLMPERNHEALRSGAQTEWICEIEGVGRVRCMSFRDHRGPGGVFRLMPTRSVSVEQLGLPRHVQSLAIEPSGLVLIAGPRSSGKRTLMAAFVDLMNRTRRDHIITIEREINIVQEGGHSFISQREVRGDDDEMVVAARAALREDPDVLVIEDLRTGPLMNVALEAAAAGRLVVGGFSAHTAAGAIDRIIDLYAPEYRRHVQMALADSLRGVVVQVLLRKIGGGRLPAREVLLNTPAVSSVIAEGKTSQLPMAIEGGRRYGMVPLNDALVGLVQSGAVEAREAYRQSPDRPGFLAALTRHGLDTSFVERFA